MRLTFLGTRANIDLRSRRHRRHSALQISQAEQKVLIDCGDDWLSLLPSLCPTAIFITHAHADHVGGLRDGAPCIVYAPEAVCESLARLDLAAKEVVPLRRPIVVGGLCLEAFPVVHSVIAPAVGYRVSDGSVTLFYVPDVVEIVHEGEALGGIDAYIGDGARLTRPLIRRHDGAATGHTSIREQVGWCRRNAVDRAIFTHCGTEIVRGDERRINAELRRIGRENGIDVRLACDGMQLELQAGSLGR